MKRLKKISIWFVCSILGLYLILCAGMYFLQEKLIFHPKKLDRNYVFQFQQAFEEINIPLGNDQAMNGVLLTCDSSRGLVFYLHGNAGAADSWGDIAKAYEALKYDIFIPDYRGFGKSDGEIQNEEQFYKDIQLSYDVLKQRYAEANIIVAGYSIGTGSAAMLAATNHPKLLILQAPFYSLVDMMHHTYPFVPDILLKYKFETFSFIPKVKAPVLIFHGDADEVIYYGSSLKLKEHFKKEDRLVTLEGAGHMGINSNEKYLRELKKLLGD